MGGHEVDVAALRDYAGNIGSYREQTAKFGEFVSQTDVGDKSWGLIGLATKSQYTNSLATLRELLGKMADGLDSIAEKVKTAADGYQDADSEFGRMLTEILDEINDAPAGE